MINLSEIEKQKAIVVREIEKLEKELIEKDVTMMCSSENVECTPLKDVKEAIEECWFIDNDNNTIDCNDYYEMDIQVGDYMIYDYDNDTKIAQICENADGKFQVYFPEYNMIDFQISDTLDELYNLWRESCDNELELIRVTDKNVKTFEKDKTYFIFREGKHYIVKYESKFRDVHDLYTDEGDVVERAESLDDLFLSTISNYSIVKELRNIKNNKYELLNDDELCEKLSQIVLKSYIDSYENVKLDNYQMIDLGENIIRYSRLNKKDIINIMNDNHIEVEKWFGVTEVVDSFLEDTNEYFLDDKTGIWYPNNLGLFPGDNILNYRDCETYEVVLVNNKYALCNNRTNKMHEKMYDTIKDMVDELFDCNYDEMMRLYKRIK